MIIEYEKYEPLLSPYFRYEHGTCWTEKYELRELDMEEGTCIRGVYDLTASRQDPFHVSTIHVMTWVYTQASIYMHREHGLERNTNGGWSRKLTVDCHRPVFKRAGITLVLRPIKKSYAVATRADIGRYNDARYVFAFDLEDGAWTGELKGSINLPAGVVPIPSAYYTENRTS